MKRLLNAPPGPVLELFGWSELFFVMLVNGLRYMDSTQDIDTSNLLEEIRKVLSQSERPLNPAAIARGLSVKTNGEALKPRLKAWAGERKLFAWPDTTYWDRDPAQIARERLLRISSREALKSDPLCKRAAGDGLKISLNVVRKVRTELTAEGKLQLAIPPRGTKKGSEFVVNPESPQPYLEAEILRLLAHFRIERSPESVRAFLSGTAAGQAQAPDVNIVADQMFAAIQRIAFAHGTTVTFHRLRQEPELAKVPKEVFDQSALLLESQRRALLSRHGYARAISEEERNRLVTDGLENYYVSIYAR